MYLDSPEEAGEAPIWYVWNGADIMLARLCDSDTGFCGDVLAEHAAEPQMGYLKIDVEGGEDRLPVSTLDHACISDGSNHR